MGQGYISKEQLQLYDQKVKKENLIDSIRNFMKIDYRTAAISGVTCLITSLGARIALHSDKPKLAIFDGVAALLSGLYFVSRCTEIAKQKEQIRETEGELKQLTESPEFKELGLVEEN